MKKRKGFSITEVVVASGITTVVITGSTTVMLSCAKLNKTSMAQASLSSEAKSVADTITADVRRSNGVLTGFTLLGTTFSVGSGTLLLSQPVTNPNGTILPNQSLLVRYKIETSGGVSRLTRASVRMNGGGMPVLSSITTKSWEDVNAVSFGFLAKPSSTSTAGGSTAGGPILSGVTAITGAVSSTVTTTVSAIGGLTSVNPTVPVSGSNVSAATFVSFTVTAGPATEKQTVCGGAQLGVPL